MTNDDTRAVRPPARILIMAVNYAPELTSVGPFNAGLAEALAADGHHVTVVTAFPYYPQWRTHEDFRGRIWSAEQRSGVRVFRVWHFVPGRPRSFTQRIAHDLTFSAHALLVAVLRAGPADVVICSAPPPFLPLSAWVVARLRHAALITKVTDISSSAASALDILRGGRVQRLARAAEGLAFRRADRVSVLAPSFETTLAQMGVARERIIEVPDWANLDEVAPGLRDNEFRAGVLRPGEEFLVLHTGNIGLKQGLVTMVDGAALATPGSRWLVVGDGEERAAMEARAGDRVSFLPLQPRERFGQVLAAADVLLLVQRAGVTDQVAPSKLLTYLAAGRPVVASAHEASEAACIVREAGCGLVVSPEDPQALAEAVDALRADPDARAEMGQRARAYAEAHFSRDAVLNSYRALIAELRK